MDLQHIPLNHLKIAAVNVRHSRQAPDTSDILPSIRRRGVLQPLLVRPNGEGFEIVAGRRRYFAVKQITEEQGTAPEEVALPCAVMGAGDDAAAVEASLIENVTHLPMHEMDQYEAFASLLKQGRSVPEIADTFGVTELTVKRRLALANLHPKIREAYRQEDIEPEDLKLLTMASKRQQREWLTCFEAETRLDAETEDNEETEPAPRGWLLKQWLFGGERIAVSAALFPAENYAGEIVADLFGEEAYFADREMFWALQSEAVAKRRDELLAQGWSEVVVLERGAQFPRWQFVEVSREDGGKVFIVVRENGEVDVHEGYLDAKTARSRRKPENGTDGETEASEAARAKPELTKAAENYVALYRHAIVRVELLKTPGVALRLAVAHMIVGSPLWSIKPEDQRADKKEIADNVLGSTAQAAFEAERAAVLELLDLEPSWLGTLARPNDDSHSAAAIFARLLALSDEQVMRVLTLAMAETLAVRSVLVEAAGALLRPDPVQWWQADDTFLDLVRDRRVVNAMLAEVAGESVANANVSETAKVQKKVIRDCLTGEGREKVTGWVPGYMAFPIRTYTPDSGMDIAVEWKAVAPLFDAAVEVKLLRKKTHRAEKRRHARRS
jgi:ParB family chromosome partitioning protein